MLYHQFITLSLTAAFAFLSVSPAWAGYVYVPDTVPQTQTVIYQQTPAQTVIVRETVPAPVYVQETPRISGETLFLAGAGTLIGGAILHSIWDRHHHYRPAPPRPHFGGHKAPKHRR